MLRVLMLFHCFASRWARSVREDVILTNDNIDCHWLACAVGIANTRSNSLAGTVVTLDSGNRLCLGLAAGLSGWFHCQPAGERRELRGSRRHATAGAVKLPLPADQAWALVPVHRIWGCGLLLP